MKYVRTKKGIYEAIKLIRDGSFFDAYDETILQEDDTIEELCDGFYNDILGEGIFNFDPLYMYLNFEDFKDDFIGYRVHDGWTGNGYGFIKTDRGLIYVAKMDSEGKLELI